MKTNSHFFKILPTALIIISIAVILPSCKKDKPSAGSAAPINYSDYANGGMHLEIVNSDPADYNDDQLYVAVIGGSPGANSQSVYIDLTTGKMIPMNSSLPKVANPNDPSGQVITVSTKMSAMPLDAATGNRSIPLPFIESARILLSIGKPLYFGVNAGGSLAAPIKSTSPTDANYETVFDFMEMTYYSTGSGAEIFANTSRVDEYALSMGFELNALQGTSGTVQRVGELLTHSATIQAFQNFSKPADFNQCYRPFFQDIVNPGGMTNASGNQIFTQTAFYKLFQGYLDSIWQNYKNTDLVFILGPGNVGSTDSNLVIRGRVDSSNVFHFIQTQTTNGTTTVQQGTLPIEPTTSDVMGGTAGTTAFNNSPLDGTPGHELDNSLRVTFVAALNRHTILSNAAAGQIQYLEDVAQFYKTPPYNYYAAFWHSPGISYGGLQYGFSYDDDAGQSSTLVGANPAYCTLYFGPVPGN
jgi:Beta-1,3-glucanase